MTTTRRAALQRPTFFPIRRHGRGSPSRSSTTAGSWWSCFPAVRCRPSRARRPPSGRRRLRPSRHQRTWASSVWWPPGSSRWCRPPCCRRCSLLTTSRSSCAASRKLTLTSCSATRRSARRTGAIERHNCSSGFGRSFVRSVPSSVRPSCGSCRAAPGCPPAGPRAPGPSERHSWAHSTSSSCALSAMRRLWRWIPARRASRPKAASTTGCRPATRVSSP
mmetsp:Transcript_8831/g.25419  ORF Transcript_8831/g.25419 Transcript_8831/m.25419 type:complete len:220 (+) Transcript_8831:1111-1770(+)